MLMERLEIKKATLVKFMQQVLNNNLTKFMHSLGKSKNHVRQFETESSQSDEVRGGDEEPSRAADRKTAYKSHYQRQSYAQRNSNY